MKVVLFLLILISFSSFSQSVYTPINSDYNYLIDRYEILKSKQILLTSFKPYSRQEIALWSDSVSKDSSLNNRDIFNLNYLRTDNNEWLDSTIKSKKPILRHFYKQPNAFAIKRVGSSFIIGNPVYNYSVGIESGTVNRTSYINTRGAEFRGGIDGRVGFYTYFTENQVSLPYYQQLLVDSLSGNRPILPGEGYVKFLGKSSNFQKLDYISARGYVTFGITKHIHGQFGYDKNFVGNGIRSLILSDYSAPYSFLKLQTKFKRVNYTNLFARMTAKVNSMDSYYPQKYFAFHHLNFTIAKKLSIGVFESIVFGRKDSISNGAFDIAYMNPVIFYRSTEQQLGSADNSILGIDWKWNFLNHFQYYGQIVIDELKAKELTSGKGWWGNKQAFQVGFKYINVLGIKNLDLQSEYNFVRPYTYSHQTAFTAYTNYGQSLAHPNGANFTELIGVLKYQIHKRVQFVQNVIYLNQGIDTGNKNFGSDVNKSYTIGIRTEYNNQMLQGDKITLSTLSSTVSWQIKHNLFLNFYMVLRKQTSSAIKHNLVENKLLGIGLKLNFF